MGPSATMQVSLAPAAAPELSLGLLGHGAAVSHPPAAVAVAVGLLGLLGFLAGWVAVRVSGAWLGRDAPDVGEDWAARARVVYPARLAGVAITLFLPFVLGVLSAIGVVRRTPFEHPPSATHLLSACAIAAGAMAGTILGAWQRERWIRAAGYSLAAFAGLWAYRFLTLLVPVGVAFIAMACSMWAVELPLAVLLGGVAAWHLAFGLGGYHLLARAIGLVRSPSPELLAAVRAAASASGRGDPRAYEVRIGHPNAFALPLANMVYVSPEALAELAPEELGSVLQHELGHLAQRRAFAWRYLRGLVAIACLVSLPRAYLRLGDVGLVLTAAPVLILPLVTRRPLRTLERDADTHAHIADGPAFARALEKIHRRAQIPMTLGNRGTHPDLYDRLVAAGAPPPFPRPAPPSRFGTHIRFMAGLLAGIGVAVTSAVALCSARKALSPPNGAPFVRDVLSAMTVPFVR